MDGVMQEHLSLTYHKLRKELDGLLRSRMALFVFFLFLFADALLIIAHLYHFLNNRFQFSSFVLSSEFTLIRERGYSEWWEYAKAGFSIGLYALCYKKSLQPVYLAIALICLWILADNALQIHESAGDVIAPLFTFAASLFPSAGETFGEFSYFILAGFAFSILFWINYRASSEAHRSLAAIFAVLVVLLAFFGVGMDAVHAALKFSGEILYHAFVILEDGGELVVLSAICAAATFTATRLSLASH
jgi:hypothetical protein